MFGRTVGAAALAATALTANAILIPAGTSASETLPFIPFDTSSRSIDLPCYDCIPLLRPTDCPNCEDDDLVFIQASTHSVRLNFTITKDGKALSQGGETIYPPEAIDMVDALFYPKVDLVVPSSGLFFDDAEAEVEDLRTFDITGESVKMDRVPFADGRDAWVTITYRIHTLREQPVSVDEAIVSLYEDEQGQLMIMDVAGSPSRSIFDSEPMPLPHSEIPDHPNPPQDECEYLPSFLCEVKDTLESKWDDLKKGFQAHVHGCHRHKGEGNGKGVYKDENGVTHLPTHHKGIPKVNPDFQDGKPHRHHPHGHQPHWHARGFAHHVIAAILMVLIPIMVGIAAGMAVSCIGMLLGHFVAFVWIKFVRGGRRGYASVPQNVDVDIVNGEEIEEVVEKGEIVLDGDKYDREAPPMYEESPAYQDRD